METEQVELKRGRGRPKGSLNKKKATEQVAEKNEPTPTFSGCLKCGFEVCKCDIIAREDD